MIDFNWSIEAKRWNDAIGEYAKITNKSTEEATFRQAKNLLFFVAKQMPQSRFKKGAYVTRLSDYFRYDPWVAGMIVAQYFKRKGVLVQKEVRRKGDYGVAYMVRGSRGRLKFGQYVDFSKRKFAVYFTKEMAIKENARRVRMINARLGFAQLIPMKAVEALKTIASKYGFNIGSMRLQGNKPNKKWQGENAMVRVNKTDKRVDISIVSAYTFKSSKTMFGKSQDANAQFYDDAIKRALPRAITLTIADIKQYIAQKIAKRGK